MDAELRPDLSRILPRPVTRPRGGLFDAVRPVAGDVPVVDYLVDVERRHAAAADDVGFDLGQAMAVAERLARSRGESALRPGLFALDPQRVQRLLS